MPKETKIGKPTAEEFRAAISKDVNRREILAGLDLKTATDEEIDARYDAALARDLEIRRVLFPPASGLDLIRRAP